MQFCCSPRLSGDVLDEPLLHCRIVSGQAWPTLTQGRGLQALNCTSGPVVWETPPWTPDVELWSVDSSRLSVLILPPQLQQFLETPRELNPPQGAGSLRRGRPFRHQCHHPLEDHSAAADSQGGPARPLCQAAEPRGQPEGFRRTKWQGRAKPSV